MIRAGARPVDLLRAALGDVPFEVLEERPVSFACTCSYERVVSLISSIERNELEAIQALREGKEPPNEKYLRLTQDAIDQENKKYERLKHAAALVTRDIEEDLREHAEEYIAHAAEKARNESVQYNAHIQEAMRAKEAVEQANQVYVTITGDDFGRRFPSNAVNKRWDQTFGVCWIPDALEDQEAQDPVISSESAAALIG